MVKDMLNQIIPIVTSAAVAVLVIIIKGVGDAAVKFIEIKKDEIIAKIGVTKYNQNKAVAIDMWNVVEEHFRINEIVNNITESKIKMFNELLLKKIPGLTQEQIDELRQAIAGEINKGKVF